MDERSKVLDSQEFCVSIAKLKTFFVISYMSMAPSLTLINSHNVYFSNYLPSFDLVITNFKVSSLHQRLYARLS